MAPGAGFEPARIRINGAAPSQLGYPGKTWSETWESNPVLMLPKHECFRNTCLRRQNLAGPSGVEPESQASETCALSTLDDRPDWTIGRRGTGGRNRTGISSL